MISRRIMNMAAVEGWAIGLINDIPPEKWSKAGYARADILFIAIAAAILSGDIPPKPELYTAKVGPATVAAGSNWSGELANKASVQKAIEDFLVAEGAQWEAIYENWQSALDEQHPNVTIDVWRGIATALARSI